MEFQPLLGNQQLHSRLQAALRQERLPHCFLLPVLRALAKSRWPSFCVRHFYALIPNTVPACTVPSAVRSTQGPIRMSLWWTSPANERFRWNWCGRPARDAYIRPNEGATEGLPVSPARTISTLQDKMHC